MCAVLGCVCWVVRRKLQLESMLLQCLCTHQASGNAIGIGAVYLVAGAQPVK
jgi:hypothetical protein